MIVPINSGNGEFNERLAFVYVLHHYTLASKFTSKCWAQEPLKWLFDIVQPYVMEYKEFPSEIIVNTLVKQDGRYVNKLTEDIIHTIWSHNDYINTVSEDWLRNTAKEIGLWNNFVYSLQKISSYVITTSPDLTFGNVRDYITRVKNMLSTDMNFDFVESAGHDFFDPAEHKMSIVETRPTGYKFFDQCLRGGWAKKTLNVIMGPPKVGKSMWLGNMCANSVLAGDNSAYITLEMSSELVNQRIGSNLLNIPINDYEKYAADENVMLGKFRELQNSNLVPLGTLVVEEFPTSSATVYDIERFLLEVERTRSTDDKPFKFRNVYIDYINIMADCRTGRSGDNTYIKIKNICEDVRAMAQRNDWCVVSLTQTNRTGMNASDLDMSAVSESSGLVATVDSMFGIICTSMMKAEGIYYIKALALRNSPHMGDKKKYNFSSDYLRIREDVTEAIIPDGMAIPSEVGQMANDNNNGSYKKPWTPVKNNVQHNNVAVSPQPASVVPPINQTFNPGLNKPNINPLGSNIGTANLFN